MTSSTTVPQSGLRSPAKIRALIFFVTIMNAISSGCSAASYMAFKFCSRFFTSISLRREESKLLWIVSDAILLVAHYTSFNKHLNRDYKQLTNTIEFTLVEQFELSIKIWPHNVWKVNASMYLDITYVPITYASTINDHFARQCIVFVAISDNRFFNAHAEFIAQRFRIWIGADRCKEAEIRFEVHRCN